MTERRSQKSEPRREEDRPVAGNAARDPKEQTRRQDLPEEENQEYGDPGRGSNPPGGERQRPRVDEDDATRGKGRHQPVATDEEREDQ